MIVKALPLARENDALKDGKALGAGLNRAADPAELAPIQWLHLDGAREDERSAHCSSSADAEAPGSASF